ncbi:phospho-N-acetylmuramoyl-pentapeptide-transferase [Saccharibacillus alkalitolerans]|uniref:Phospho-N-acetylmuramoyl-pentapeptide-transferase n=1 Tax=Saccharibacillus alkalitolerans TaxID=2705290 RepID=A0ABX0F6V6_9BACL|nr:phospho-N-acetylmuramoyl-pentapeptide-transferase [Saccharibacillus alkalitolerans]NGZ76048.1 phospho-N-acetylmuramoyl-pentapeptide-transferase [Saccharibacillus alkalitolerans]
MNFYTLIAAVLSFVLVALMTPVWIRTLRRIGWLQPIRKELPPDHQAKKGTPLMAGMVFMIGVLIALIAQPTPLMWLLAASFVLFGIVGFSDDFKKAAFQDPQGISGKAKLVFQFAFTITLLLIAMNSFGVEPTIAFPGGFVWVLPAAIYFIIMLLFIVGSANAINFTDGLDGLLIIVSIPTYLFFFVISDEPAIKLFSLVMIGALFGLLLYNKYPAKAFMGDTGSLAIGGSLSLMAVLEKVEILVPLLFIIYFAEQFSVIIQVAYYKRTKKRIFRMTPIHYHYSLKYGWNERKIVAVFGCVSWIGAFLSWLIWYLWM